MIYWTKTGNLYKKDVILVMQKKYLFFMAAAHICNDINSGALPAILPFFVLYYGMDYTSMAGLMFASAFLSSFIQPLFGYLADRASRQWFMGFGVLLTGGCLGLTGLLTDYWAIFAAVTFMGIGSAIFHPEAARMVNFISGQQRGSGMSIFSVGGNAGFGLGPLAAVALITAFGMQGTVFFGIVAVIMSVLLFIYIPKIKRAAEAAMAAERDAAAAAGTPLRCGAEPVNDWHGFSRLTFVIVFRSIVFCGISSFLPLYCIQVLGSSNAAGSATLSVLSIAGIFTTLVGGRLADRFGYVTVLKYGCLLLVPLLAAAVYAQSIWVVYALLIPMSFAMHGPYSSFVVLGQSYLARSIGFASGVTLGLSFSVGGIVVPSLGWYADMNGITAVMTLIVLCAVCCAACCFLLPEPRRA